MKLFIFVAILIWLLILAIKNKGLIRFISIGGMAYLIGYLIYTFCSI